MFHAIQQKFGVHAKISSFEDLHDDHDSYDGIHLATITVGRTVNTALILVSRVPRGRVIQIFEHTYQTLVPNKKQPTNINKQ